MVPSNFDVTKEDKNEAGQYESKEQEHKSVLSFNSSNLSHMGGVLNRVTKRKNWASADSFLSKKSAKAGVHRILPA